MRTKRIRTFVAIELDDRSKDMLRRALTALEIADIHRRARWVSADRVHLTLLFLGALDEGRVPAVAEAMTRACARFAPFPIASSEPGFFPDASRPAVAWLGVRGD